MQFIWKQVYFDELDTTCSLSYPSLDPGVGFLPGQWGKGQPLGSTLIHFPWDLTGDGRADWGKGLDWPAQPHVQSRALETPGLLPRACEGRDITCLLPSKQEMPRMWGKTLGGAWVFQEIVSMPAPNSKTALIGWQT